MATLYTTVAKRFIFGILFLCALIFALPLYAQDGVRKYSYDFITYDITINEDTTFDVLETQSYNFIGEYHKGWRSIPYKDISAITDISVYDINNNKPLVYSPTPLEKTDPNNWGKYTYTKSNGAMNIEWYFDAKDEKRIWHIEYTVHGGITFLDSKDELYWNLFSDYEVPIKAINARVYIPKPAPSRDDLSVQMYIGGNSPSSQQYGYDVRYGLNAFDFAVEDIAPFQTITIATGWPIGMIDRSEFWKDWFLIHLAPIISIFIIVITIISGFLYWYFTEKRNKGRGIIIAQYEPPRNLRPAMAEIIMREKVTPKGWAATVVDLAVRGYLSIKIDPPVGLDKISRIVLMTIPFVFIAIVGFLFLGNGFSVGSIPFLMIFMVILLFGPLKLIKKSVRSGNSFLPSDYIIERVKEPDDSLEDYEKSFMNVLGASFSTREMRKDPARSKGMYMVMQKIKDELLIETETDTGAYDKLLSKEKIKRNVFIACMIIAFLVFQLPVNLWVDISGSLMIFGVSVFCAIALAVFIKYEARLSHDGAILREEWLGFKLYLQTAERNRLQNLTPETFERFLPYAIIFGVEKKWGRAFDALHMREPGWYAGAYVHGSFAGSSAPSFSASAFSASFSSSFTSAFSSSGGGGASGGGGGAGGGGGGGGGGAS